MTPPEVSVYVTCPNCELMIYVDREIGTVEKLNGEKYYIPCHGCDNKIEVSRRFLEALAVVCRWRKDDSES